MMEQDCLGPNPNPAHTSCVTSDTLLNLLVPQFLHLQNRDYKYTYLMGWLKGLNSSYNTTPRIVHET